MLDLQPGRVGKRVHQFLEVHVVLGLTLAAARLELTQAAGPHVGLTQAAAPHVGLTSGGGGEWH